MTLFEISGVARAETNLTCKYNDEFLAGQTVKILVDEETSMLTYFYQTQDEQQMMIFRKDETWIEASGKSGKVIINKISGKFGYAFVIPEVNGNIWGNFIDGWCYRSAF